jgi:hypothetical protein
MMLPGRRPLMALTQIQDRTSKALASTKRAALPTPGIATTCRRRPGATSVNTMHTRVPMPTRSASLFGASTPARQDCRDPGVSARTGANGGGLRGRLPEPGSRGEDDGGGRDGRTAAPITRSPSSFVGLPLCASTRPTGPSTPTPGAGATITTTRRGGVWRGLRERRSGHWM